MGAVPPPATGPPPGPRRPFPGKLIKYLGYSMRHFYYVASEFSVATTEHRESVPQGHFWVFKGGYLTRGTCTATAYIGIYTPDDVLRRRLLVLGSGQSDTTDIPDNVARIRESEIVNEKEYIKVLLSAAQSDDTYIAFTILEREAK